MTEETRNVTRKTAGTMMSGTKRAVKMTGVVKMTGDVKMTSGVKTTIVMKIKRAMTTTRKMGKKSGKTGNRIATMINKS